eukprot:89842_1
MSSNAGSLRTPSGYQRFTRNRSDSGYSNNRSDSTGYCQRFCCLLIACGLSQVMCKCDMDDLEEYLHRLCGCICIHGALYIAALIIGFGFECDYNILLIDPNIYLKIIGFFGLLELICAARWRYEIKKMDEGVACSCICGIIWDLLWAVIGSILYMQMNWDCKHSAVGFMIFSYCIIKWIFIGGRIIFIISGCYVSQNVIFLDRMKSIDELYLSVNEEENEQLIEV